MGTKLSAVCRFRAADNKNQNLPTGLFSYDCTAWEHLKQSSIGSLPLPLGKVKCENTVSPCPQLPPPDLTPLSLSIVRREVTFLVNRGQIWRHPENSTDISGMAQISPYEDLIVYSLAFKVNAILGSGTKLNFLCKNHNAMFKALLSRVICKILNRRREWNIILHLIYINFFNHML